MKEKKNEIEERLHEVENDKQTFNISAIDMVYKLTLTELDFNISHVKHIAVDGDDVPKHSSGKINKYKKWFRLGYVNTRFKKVLGVDLEKIKFDYNKNDRIIYVYGFEADSAGVKDEEVLEEVYLEYKKDFSKDEYAMNNTDEISKKIRKCEEKSCDLYYDKDKKYEYRVARGDDGVIKFGSEGLGSFQKIVDEEIREIRNSSCGKEFEIAAKICRDQFKVILDLIFTPMGYKIKIADSSEEVPSQAMSLRKLQEEFNKKIFRCCRPVVVENVSNVTV